MAYSNYAEDAQRRYNQGYSKAVYNFIHNTDEDLGSSDDWNRGYGDAYNHFSNHYTGQSFSDAVKSMQQNA